MSRKPHLFIEKEIEWLKENSNLCIDEQVEKFNSVFGADVSYGSIVGVRLRYGIKRDFGRHAIFTNEIYDFIKKNQYVYKPADMVREINKKFGTDYTQKQLNHFIRNHNLQYRLFRPEILDYMREHKETDRSVMCNDINRLFGTSFTRRQITSAMNWYKITDNHKPLDKKGGRPERLINAERLRKGGHSVWEVKTANGWRFKHHIIWEQANGRKVKKNECVIFADGNINNFDVDNLICIPRSVLGTVNCWLSGFRGGNRETATTKIKIAELMSVINKKKKEIKVQE